MKKSFTIFIVFLLSFNLIYANDCFIKEWPSTELLEYLKTNRKIISNITKETNNKEISDEKRIDSWEKIRKIFNEMIDFNWYISYLNYYILFPLSNDVTYETKRDYRLLENEWELLNKYLDTIINNWYDNLSIENACEWINSEYNCNLSWNVIDLIWILIKNHSNLLNNYRKIITWWSVNDLENIKFVNSDFNTNLIINYWWNNWCSSIEWSFWSKIKEKIKNIELINEQWEEAWKDIEKSWNLLVWKTVDNKLEENLLSKELERQWISWSKADAMINNLKNYNDSKWFSWILKNNFLVNSAKYLLDWTKNQINNFYKDFVKNYPKSNNWTSTTELINNKNDNDIDIEIATSINEIYNKEIPFIAIWDWQSTQIRKNLKSLHEKLNKSITIIYNSCKSARTVCKMQDYLLWDCWSCN